jgi:Fe-S cluster biosynthesis and repair protein YggX
LVGRWPAAGVFGPYDFPMLDINQRIAQFETMVRPEADPNNDMAWFSLGSAYAQAGRHADAATALIRCFELNPAMSKAYQLAGKALIDAGDKEQAGEVLTAGYKIAAGKGEMLEQLGLPVPTVQERQPGPAADGSFVCFRTGRPGRQMARPPFKGPVGTWIFEHISQQTFDEWIKQGTKVINELRLDLSRDEDALTYDRHMREYLGIDEALLVKLETGA